VKTSTAKKQKHTTPADEPDLRLTMDQYRSLERIWYSLGELFDMIPAPGNSDGGLECLKLVDSSMAEVMNELQEQVDERKKGGAA
jgi:hypothetical protein